MSWLSQPALISRGTSRRINFHPTDTTDGRVLTVTSLSKPLTQQGRLLVGKPERPSLNAIHFGALTESELATKNFPEALDASCRSSVEIRYRNVQLDNSRARVLLSCALRVLSRELPSRPLTRVAGSASMRQLAYARKVIVVLILRVCTEFALREEMGVSTVTYPLPEMG